MVGAAFGLLAAMLAVYSAWHGYFRVLRIVEFICYPALELTDRLVRMLFPYEHIGPGRMEALVGDILLCVISSLLWAALGGVTGWLFIFRSHRSEPGRA